MLERIARILRRKKEVPERIVLGDDGFDLYTGDHLKYRVLWNEVDRIDVFKEDLVTYDMVCMEFIVRSKDMVFPVNDEVEGFWEMVNRVKEVLPTSRQDWEAVVIKPAFARNHTVIYERSEVM
jgi:hypothetical protein